MPGEKEIDAKKLFGEDSVLHVQKPAGISTENLEDYYKRSFQEEEQRINEAVHNEIDDLFDDYEDEYEDEEDLDDDVLFEDEMETDDNPLKQLFTDPDLEKEVASVTEDEFEELLKSPEALKIKAITESPVYPPDFPKFEDLLKLKKIHGNIIVVLTGNLLEEFQYSVVPKIFLCTTFKTRDYLDFTNVYPESDELMLYPFVAVRCTLFPKLDYDSIMELNAGIIKKIAENVLINSDYKTSLEVIVL